MTPGDPWLAALWPFVRAHLPGAPASVVEIGCGPLGGFVPAMRAAGYQATGVDPEAPQGPEFRRTVFGLAARFDAGLVRYGPYFFADLAGLREADEQTAIDGGQIQANRIQYVGRRSGVRDPRPG